MLHQLTFKNFLTRNFNWNSLFSHINDKFVGRFIIVIYFSFYSLSYERALFKEIILLLFILKHVNFYFKSCI